MKKNKNQYVQVNKDWLVAKSQEDGVKALPKGIFYKVLAERRDECDTHAQQRNHRPLHGQDHRWGDIRQQPWRRAPGLPPARPHRRLDHRHAADAHRRPMGSLHPRRNGLRQVLASPSSVTTRKSLNKFSFSLAAPSVPSLASPAAPSSSSTSNCSPSIDGISITRSILDSAYIARNDYLCSNN